MLAQLERDYEKAKKKGARPELLRKIEDDINRIKSEKDSNQGDLQLKNEDPFEVLFKKALDVISRRYIAGTIKYIREHHRSLYEQTDQAEDQLNEVWKAGLKGEATLKEFRGILIKWYSLHIKGIEICKDLTRGDR